MRDFIYGLDLVNTSLYKNRYHRIETIRNIRVNGFKLHLKNYNRVIVNVENIESIYSNNRKKCQVHFF